MPCRAPACGFAGSGFQVLRVQLRSVWVGTTSVIEWSSAELTWTRHVSEITMSGGRVRCAYVLEVGSRFQFTSLIHRSPLHCLHLRPVNRTGVPYSGNGSCSGSGTWCAMLTDEPDLHQIYAGMGERVGVGPTAAATFFHLTKKKL